MYKNAAHKYRVDEKKKERERNAGAIEMNLSSRHAHFECTEEVRTAYAESRSLRVYTTAKYRGDYFSLSLACSRAGASRGKPVSRNRLPISRLIFNVSSQRVAARERERENVIYWL